MKILAIGGSNSKSSINRQLALFTAHLFENATVSSIDISTIGLDLYSVDKEKETGIPAQVLDFAQQIDQSDLLVVSLAEHNGSFSIGFKNLLDWTSRIKDRPTFNQKPMLLMATSPGARGGQTVLETAKNLFPFSGAQIKATFSLPSFYQNFDPTTGIKSPEHLAALKAIVAQLSTR
jgi:chromate reductase, NAD(P)H dehydrogenase (quinone)